MKLGRKLAEGKTKIVFEDAERSDCVILESKDSITAGDGARRNFIPGKGAISGRTTANCFAFLNANGVRTHFIEAVDDAHLRAKKCAMIPVEAVARRIATGSFLKRNPQIVEGTRFEPLVTEFFLKDDARHDPLVTKDELVRDGVLEPQEFDEMNETLQKVFLLFEQAWAKQGVVLVDLKIEFGRTSDGNLVVADVIDNDSWRIWPGGEKSQMLDKQIYRNKPIAETDDAFLQQLKQKYEAVMRMTEKFLG